MDEKTGMEACGSGKGKAFCGRRRKKVFLLMRVFEEGVVGEAGRRILDLAL